MEAAVKASTTTVTSSVAAQGVFGVRRPVRTVRVGTRRRPRSGLVAVERRRVPARACPPPAVAEGPYRLTRGARLALTAVALVTMSVVAVRLSGGGSDVTALVTVTAGDSLWSIARSVEPDGDIGSVVGAIMELNGLTASEIHPGQRLRIPVP